LPPSSTFDEPSHYRLRSEPLSGRILHQPIAFVSGNRASGSHTNGFVICVRTGFPALGQVARSLNGHLHSVTEVESLPTGAAGLTRSDRPILLKPCRQQTARGQLTGLLP